MVVVCFVFFFFGCGFIHCCNFSHGSGYPIVAIFLMVTFWLIHCCGFSHGFDYPIVVVFLMVVIRAVKMGYNPRTNPIHHRFESGWVEKKLQISVRVNNEPNPLRIRLIRVEPVMSRVGSPTRQ